MRWDNLFDDLEGQLEYELGAEEIDLRSEEERLRIGRLSVRARMLALHAGADSVGSRAIRAVLIDGTTLTLRPMSFGKDWFSADLMDGAQRRSQCIVPLAALAGLALDRAQVARSLDASEGATRALSARLGINFVLRDLCRRRCSLELHTVGGMLHGTIDRVGRDHFDLAVHEPGSSRRESEVSEYRIVPVAQLLLVRV